MKEMKKAQGVTPPSSLSGKMIATIGTLVTVVLGATMRGDWMIVLVHLSKQFGWKLSPLTQSRTSDYNINQNENDTESIVLNEQNLFAGVHWFVLLSVGVSFASYLSLGGYLQYYYYIKRRDQAKEWKCQPNKFLTPENERHEFMLGSLNMAIGGTASGVIACYIMNGGHTTLFFSALERGWLYLIVSTLILFFSTDYLAYWVHRAGHFPWLYKTIHKMHHRYHQPTAWSATAMHPLEFITYQAILATPAFLVPLYSGSFIGVLLYQYYYGMIDHSGIMMDSIWPWQPPSIFHDNHHKHFHVNFGFNLSIWDKYHDTLRKETRVYGEKNFGGRGVESSASKTHKKST